MPEPTTLPLRVVDALQELTAVPAIAPDIHAPRPAMAASVEAVLERLATWSDDFAAGSAPATVTLLHFAGVAPSTDANVRVR